MTTAENKQSATAGPWKIDGDRDQDFGLCIVQESTGGVICQIESTPGYVDGSIRFTKKRQSDSDPHHPANILMCAAIEKAEGL